VPPSVVDSTSITLKSTREENEKIYDLIPLYHNKDITMWNNISNNDGLRSKMAYLYSRCLMGHREYMIDVDSVESPELFTTDSVSKGTISAAAKVDEVLPSFLN
jgi:hypothetical protein